jgi:UDP-N-acetylglucosamine--N-acetylmuramyl-(pentapeptide) pyrophosphoryl-undecaprenol N-acetylglucosamine transferase
MLWQTGVNYTFDGNLPENIKMVKFIEDMASAYAAADLVVSRSGATSVAEICCTGKPSILIPLPTASNNEQALNALALLNNNAAILLDNSKAEAYLADLIISTLSEQKLLEEMGNKAKALGRPDAGHTIADFILSGDSIEQIASEETF